MRIRLAMWVVAAFLFMPTVAKADGFAYAYNFPNLIWVFEVPSLITSTTTISGTNTTLSAAITPLGGFAGCTSISSIVIAAPQSTNPAVETFLSGTGACSGGVEVADGFPAAIDSVGTFHDSPGSSTTLTISSLTPVSTPEPSSLLLLGTGLIGVFGSARRKLIG
jgi:PEP-CTERM motif